MDRDPGLRVFVAGATGYTGRHVVQQLARSGHTVFAHIRPGSPSLGTWGPRLEEWGATLDTTPWALEPLVETLKCYQFTHVFSLLGTTARRQKTTEPEATYERVDRDLSLLLHQAACRTSSAPVFVYLSSLGADRPGRSAYMRARFEVEQVLSSRDLPWITVRPSFITGPDRDEDRRGERWVAATGDTLLAVLGTLGARTLRDRYSSVTGQQLAQALIAVALDPETRNCVVQTDQLRRFMGAR